MAGYGDYGTAGTGKVAQAPMGQKAKAEGTLGYGAGGIQGGLGNLAPTPIRDSKFSKAVYNGVNDGGTLEFGKMNIASELKNPKDFTGPAVSAQKGAYAAEIWANARRLAGDNTYADFIDVRNDKSDKASAATSAFLQAFERGEPLAKSAWMFANNRYGTDGNNGLNYTDKGAFKKALQEQGMGDLAKGVDGLTNNSVGWGSYAALALANGLDLTGKDGKPDLTKIGIAKDGNMKQLDAIRGGIEDSMASLNAVMAGQYEGAVTAKAEGGGDAGKGKGVAKPPQAPEAPKKVEANKEGETKVDTPKADAVEPKAGGLPGGIEQILTLLVQLLTQLLNGKGGQKTGADSYGAMEPKKDTAAAEEKANSYLKAYDAKGGIGAGAKPMAAAAPKASGGY
jgi:hypothetical protein